MRLRSILPALLAGGLVLAACGDAAMPSGEDVSAQRELADPTADAAQPQAGLAGGAPKFWDTNAAANWDEFATALTFQRVIDANRMYAYLALAQLRAAEAAAEGAGPHPPTAAAIGAASATILGSFFPLDVAQIEAALDAQLAAKPWPGAKHQDNAAGEALGREVAAAVLAFAAGDRIGLSDPGTPPLGPGYWVWNGGPIVRGNYGARPFVLETGNEFLPPPPPAFGSAEFLTALAEVRSIADTRTTEQTAIANYWNVNQSGRSNAAMHGLAVEFIRKYRVSDAKAARILFTMNASVFDALIACFNAKYHYWFIRPSQADPLIATVFPPPPHPSYPSAHSCVSGAATGALAAFFPSETPRLEEAALEASLSRLYAGIHYRFDMVAGLALGRSVAATVVAADLDVVDITP
ncbi:MAG TPA: phosphatase PAP2 family protein [Gemmatimonadales bacterium]|nr:phosphatase PAP2 family protein [Gemmatimonadales bacterium]